MTLETIPFDAARLLNTPGAQAEYLALAFESGDPARVAKAFGTVARAHGMANLAEEIGITRQGLAKALGEGGNPTLATLLALTKALGFRVTVEPLTAA
jgi:probable addiction module antidote protein